MANHIPGPWKATGTWGGKWYIHRKSADCDGGYFCQVEPMNKTKVAHDIAQANARLIAAAPSLLLVAQLVTMVPLQHGAEIPRELMEAAQAAIAKATPTESEARDG